MRAHRVASKRNVNKRIGDVRTADDAWGMTVVSEMILDVDRLSAFIADGRIDELQRTGYTAVKHVIMEALWPETDASTSRRRLHHAVYIFRQALAAVRPAVEFVLFDNGQYLLNPELHIEDHVAIFEQLIASCRGSDLADPHRLVEIACSLINISRCDFLDDTPSEDWAIRERDRLRLAFLAAAREVAESLQNAGLVDDCTKVLHRALDVDPCNEAAHRTLMKAHHDADLPVMEIPVGEAVEPNESYGRG
jgi:DNA-binding SARP family transcriptional activator